MSRLFLIFYFILLSFFWLLVFPFLVILSKKPKYKFSIPARFFLKNNPSFQNHNIWLHGCSLGEIKSLEPIVEKLNTNISISAITQTGHEEAKTLSKDVRYLPFEIFLPFWIKKTKTLVVTEAELWLMLFFIAKKKGAKTILINSRISDKSWKGYLRFKKFYKLIFSNIDLVFAQSQKDKKRLEALGAKNIEICGNIKISNEIKITNEYKKPNKKIIILASTHEGEEELLLEELKNEDAMILVVPRHPERFKKVENLIEKYAKKYSKTYKSFSKKGFSECDVFLCDTMGELINFYAISDIVILGGSFVEKIGGHNPIEPANFQKIVISGEYIFNQYVLYSQVENIYFAKINEISSLLKNPLKKTKIKSSDGIERIIKSIKEDNETRKSI